MHSKDTGQISVRPALTATPCQQLPHANSDPTPTAIPRRQPPLGYSEPSPTATHRQQQPHGETVPSPTAIPRQQRPLAVIYHFFMLSTKFYPLRSFHSLVTTLWTEHDLKQTPLQSITSTPQFKFRKICPSFISFSYLLNFYYQS